MKLLSLATPLALLTCAGLLAAPATPVAADLHAMIQVIHHVPAHLHSALSALPELNDAPTEDEMMELPELMQQFFQPKAGASRWSYPTMERIQDRIQQLPATTADDIMSAVANFQQRSSASSVHSVQDDGDDYPQCEEVIYETAQHLINGTIDFIEQKCSNESLPEQAKKICHFLTTHEEGVAGFITGFAQPYVLGYFYAAGNGSCPLHPFPVNSTTFSMSSNLNLGTYDPHTWLQQLVDDNEFDIMSEMYSMSDEEDVALPQLSGASAEWSAFFRHLLPVDQQETLSKQLQGGGEDDDDKCKKCYIKVVSKYIKVVRQLRAKYCEKTKCDYIKNEVCKYLDDHQEFEVGLILGALRPFKFAAGYCMGSKKCVPHNVTEMAIESSFAAVQIML